MGFTGLYFEYKYYSWWVFVFLYRRGTYDYWNGREAVCGLREQTKLVKVCLTPCNAKKYVNSQRVEPKIEEEICK